MPISLLNLISTPVPVLNTIGLNLRVGLSSEDPMVGRHPSEPYEAFLTVYSPEGTFLERSHLGRIPPSRRRFFDISIATQKMVPGLDHLTVAHRIPSRLASDLDRLEDPLELEGEPDYSMFRGLVEYSFPEGGNGSVIYETPPFINAGNRGTKSSNTFTFTGQTILSELVNTYVVVIHYSVNPSYSNVASYNFALHSLSGEHVLTDGVTIPAFGIKVLDLKQLIPAEVILRNRDPQDGLSAFTFVGYSDDAALQIIILNVTPSLGAVAVEHTHPTQTYLFPQVPDYRREVKASAQDAWKRIFSKDKER